MITHLNWTINRETIDFIFSEVHKIYLLPNPSHVTKSVVWRIAHHKVFMVTEFNRIDIDFFAHGPIRDDDFFEEL